MKTEAQLHLEYGRAVKLAIDLQRVRNSFGKIEQISYDQGFVDGMVLANRRALGLFSRWHEKRLQRIRGRVRRASRG